MTEALLVVQTVLFGLTLWLGLYLLARERPEAPLVLPGLTLTVRSRPAEATGAAPALFVHGLGGSSQNWSALMPLLAGPAVS